jgi:hypothetical protein
MVLSPHPYWIAHCKELYLDTVEKREGPRKPWQECPPDKRVTIREAFVYFGLLADQKRLASGGSI